MPVHNVGDRTNLDRSDVFLALKAKGEKVNFRLAQPTYTYDAKHFTQDSDGKWIVKECPRIMLNEDCHSCETYFEYAKEIKALKEQKGSADKVKKLENEAKKYKAKTTFNYAILNRDTKQAQILQVSLMIRLKIDELFNAGFNVVGSDFIYTRTEKPGTEYYSFLRKDSADVEDLDKDEEAEFKKAQEFDLEKMTLDKKGSGSYEQPPMPDDEDQA